MEIYYPPLFRRSSKRKKLALKTTALSAAILFGSMLGCSPPPTTQKQEKAPAESGQAPSAGTPKVLPRPDFHFTGKVGRTFQDSDPAQFPQPVQAPKGAPNIVLILIDDAGFGQFSTF